MSKVSYWNGNSPMQKLYEELNKLVPSMGAVEDARGKNRNLEKLRVAANCYYDLFNNGLCNRSAQFRRVFGFGGTAISKANFNNPWLEQRLEQAMDGFILAAAVEQGVNLKLFTGVVTKEEVAA